jgi:shikimate 5-dehydrogenase
VGRIFTFVGVSTAGSSIMRVFPRWRAALELGDDVEMAGVDLALDASRDEYRDAVATIARDESNLGALVTTHKLALLDAAADLFDEISDDARLLAEVSCISKHEGRLVGSAKDPISAARALGEIIEANHFADGGDAFVMGAGGAGMAIAVHLAARRADRPARVIVSDTSPERLVHLERAVRAAGHAVPVATVRNDTPGTHETVLAGLAERSLIVNATGMGKDRPGSPLAAVAEFPRDSVAWELNYRGELGFLRQAEEQRESGGLTVADGWGYFIHGWAAVIEEVFARPITDDELETLSEEAAGVRSG